MSLLLRTAAAVVAIASLAGCGKSFCDTHKCINNFDRGKGYIVQCGDGEWSHSGGKSGACSYHGGESNVTVSNNGQTTTTSEPPPPPPPPPPATASGSDFCSNHSCINNFDAGTGYIVQCADREWSHSGGESGACSHHGGETNVTASDNGQTTTPPPDTTPPTTSISTPTITAPPTPPDSRPALSGADSGVSGAYALTITSLTADHALDVAGVGEPTPQFGLNFTARCQQPDGTVVTWKIKAGNDPSEETFATCLQGTFGSFPQTLSVKGCGPHTLTATPVELGTSPTVTPISIPFTTC
jgi:hypothetical protein